MPKGWPLYPGAGRIAACLWLPGLCAGAASWKSLLGVFQIQEVSSSCVGLCHRGGDAWDADKRYEYHMDNGYLLIKSGEIYLFSAWGLADTTAGLPCEEIQGTSRNGGNYLVHELFVETTSPSRECHFPCILTLTILFLLPIHSVRLRKVMYNPAGGCHLYLAATSWQQEKGQEWSSLLI